MTLPQFADLVLHLAATGATLTIAWAALASYRNDRRHTATAELLETDAMAGTALVIFLAVMLGAIWL